METKTRWAKRLSLVLAMAMFAAPTVGTAATLAESNTVTYVGPAGQSRGLIRQHYHAEGDGLVSIEVCEPADGRQAQKATEKVEGDLLCETLSDSKGITKFTKDDINSMLRRQGMHAGGKTLSAVLAFLLLRRGVKGVRNIGRTVKAYWDVIRTNKLNTAIILAGVDVVSDSGPISYAAGQVAGFVAEGGVQAVTGTVREGVNLGKEIIISEGTDAEAEANGMVEEFFDGAEEYLDGAVSREGRVRKYLDPITPGLTIYDNYSLFAEARDAQTKEVRVDDLESMARDLRFLIERRY